MTPGETKTITIASENAYGEAGIPDYEIEGEYLIPPNTDITFDIELVDIVAPPPLPGEASSVNEVPTN